VRWDREHLPAVVDVDFVMPEKARLDLMSELSLCSGELMLEQSDQHYFMGVDTGRAFDFVITGKQDCGRQWI
jgi:hypothetical protein